MHARRTAADRGPEADPSTSEPLGPSTGRAVTAAGRLALLLPILWLLERGATAALRGDVLPAAIALGAVGCLAAAVLVLAAGVAAATDPPFAVEGLGRR